MGLLQCFGEFPEAIYAIGNAPTALLALCEVLPQSPIQPALVIGAPVGFVSVVESKAVLAQQNVPQIRINGRKGGSPATAAIVNALILLAWQREK
jgi:precorrin-8X/cobalt-precorrin-8 methylmutase